MIISIFLSGICMATFAASGVFFLKYWKASKDRFFLFFSVACWLLSIERIALVFLTNQYTAPDHAEVASWIYIFRLLAFAMILIAIVEKNRAKRQP
jgi:hypothetical protein